MISDQAVRQHIQAGGLIESESEMSAEYKQELIRILTVSGDTELVSAPAYWYAARSAPSTNAMVSALAIIQDELSHAHIAYHLMEDLGVDKEWLIYERPPKQYKYPYAFDVPLENWNELVTANALYDQAGYTLLGDVYKHTSFAPWKRALAKVDKEESFHLRHGQNWMRRIAQSAEGRAQLQKCVDWQFYLTVEWFGLPDTMKLHSGQLDYRLKGYTNDQLRQNWMRVVVPFLESIGIYVKAHYDKPSDSFMLDYHLPIEFDEQEKRWLFDQPITWDQVMVRWRRRGPMNEAHIGNVQRGFKQLAPLLMNGNGKH
jgi:ring-1,2-phenylacetyl-CoA epoxidase subunit PaaA